MEQRVEKYVFEFTFDLEFSTWDLDVEDAYTGNPVVCVGGFKSRQEALIALVVSGLFK